MSGTPTPSLSAWSLSWFPSSGKPFGCIVPDRAGQMVNGLLVVSGQATFNAVLYVPQGLLERDTTSTLHLVKGKRCNLSEK